MFGRKKDKKENLEEKSTNELLSILIKEVRFQSDVYCKTLEHMEEIRMSLDLINKYAEIKDKKTEKLLESTEDMNKHMKNVTKGLDNVNLGDMLQSITDTNGYISHSVGVMAENHYRELKNQKVPNIEAPADMKENNVNESSDTQLS